MQSNPVRARINPSGFSLADDQSRGARIPYLNHETLDSINKSKINFLLHSNHKIHILLQTKKDIKFRG